MNINKSNVVYLFPGQGAQYQGMALDFLNTGSRAVKELFESASDICGRNMEALLRDTDEEILKRTDVSQPALTLANLSAAAYLAEQGFSPVCCAGFSLGEYAALTCAGIIGTDDCLRLVNARGMAMQKTVDDLQARTDSAAAPGMAAVIGLAPEQVENLIAQWTLAGLTDLYAANINSKKQVAVSGTAAALEEAGRRFIEAGARRFLRLKVAGPFHSPLMADAAETFKAILDSVEFNEPAIPVFSNVTGKIIASGAEAKRLALAQITSPVRWVDEETAVMDFAHSRPGGVSACLEAGPGSVLEGLWRAADSAIPCYAAGTVEDIARIGA
jgi:[acyl-carrier-protein] S-malonyltransferase